MKFTSLYNLNESRVNNLRNKNYAPNITNDNFIRNRLITFYTKFPNGTKESENLDWGNSKNLSNTDFDFLDNYVSKEPDENNNFKILVKSKSELTKDKKRKEYSLNKSAEDIFSNKKLFYTYPEISNDNWFFVSPLNYEAAKFMDSIKCGGAGARWCIGWEKDSQYWDDYEKDNTSFIMAFNKHYKDLSNIKINGKSISPDDLNDFDISARYSGEGMEEDKICKNKEIFTKFMFEINNFSNSDDDDISEDEILWNLHISNIWIQPDYEYSLEEIKGIFNIDFGITESQIKQCILKLLKVKEFKNALAFGYDVDLNTNKVIIPEGTTRIESRAFKNCKLLKNLIIPDTVTSIGEESFSGCINLENIQISNSISEIGKGAFEGCKNLKNFRIPDNLRVLNDYLFYNCKKLESITIPDNIIKIGNNVFEDCDTLEYLNIPDSVKEIGTECFWACERLQEISLPSELSILSKSLFYCCYNLKKVNIPNTVKRINDNAFSFCESLENIIIPDSVEYLGKSSFSLCKSLKSITIPDSVLEIKEYAFSDCVNLESMKLSNSIREIPTGFISSKKLRNLEIPNSVEKIDSWAIDLDSLELLVLPRSLKSIKANAFKKGNNTNCKIKYLGTKKDWDKIVVTNYLNNISDDKVDIGNCKLYFISNNILESFNRIYKKFN